jgi:hypothetical protein
MGRVTNADCTFSPAGRFERPPALTSSACPVAARGARGESDGIPQGPSRGGVIFELVMGLGMERSGPSARLRCQGLIGHFRQSRAYHKR